MSQETSTQVVPVSADVAINTRRPSYVDRGTQTEPDNVSDVSTTVSTPTVNITLPHTQLSIYHIPQQQEVTSEKRMSAEKRISGIIVSSSSPDGSAVSISLPNRISVSSMQSPIEKPPTPTTTRSRNSIIIMDGSKDNVISIDLLPSATTPEDPTNELREIASSVSEFDGSNAAPAYEEVISSAVRPVMERSASRESLASSRRQSVPFLRLQEVESSSILESIGESAEEETDEGAMRRIETHRTSLTVVVPEITEPLPVMSPSVAAVMLPPLGVSEFIQQQETAAALQSLAADWPVLHSGFVLRKDLSTNPLSTSANKGVRSRALAKPSATKMLSRGIGSLLKSKSKGKKTELEAVVEQKSSKDSDEWELYFAEVRGRYLMFYVLLEPPRSPQPATPGAASGSSTRNPLFPETQPSKSFHKFFTSIGKKNRHGRKPSMEFQKPERISVDKRRPSNDSLRSYMTGLGPYSDMRNAPRSLVHYMPLHKATVDIIANSNGIPTSWSMSSAHGEPTSTSHLILTTGVSTLSRMVGGGGMKAEQILLDVVTYDELLWDQLTQSSAASAVRDSPTRKQEIHEWIVAIQAVSDLTKKELPTLAVHKSAETVASASMAESIAEETEAQLADDDDMDRDSLPEKSSFHSSFYDRLPASPSSARFPQVQEREEVSIRVQESSPPPPSRAAPLLEAPPTPPARSSKIPRTPLRTQILPSIGTDGVPQTVILPVNTTVSTPVNPDGPVMSSFSEAPSSGSLAPAGGHHSRGISKLFGNRWKKEKEPPKTKIVISGPTNFVKVESGGIPADMTMMQATMMQAALTSDAQRLDVNPYAGRERDPSPGPSNAMLDHEVFNWDEKRKAEEKKIKKKNSRPEKEDNAVVAAFQKASAKLDRDRREKEEKKKEKERAKPTNLSGASLVEPESQASSTKLFFPFLNKNKNLFAPKGKEISLPLPPATGLHRSATSVSRTSTLRRRVGKSRPASSGTLASTKGTIGSGYREHVGDVPLLLQKCIKLVEEIGLENEGLYRISGSAATVARLRHLFDADPNRVELRPPPESSSTTPLSSPVSDLVPVLPRRSSRLSLAETVSSGGGGRSSLDVAPSVVGPPQRHMRRVSTSSIPPMVASHLLGSNVYDNDVHVLTSVIKGFLRDGMGPKKEPLCSFDLYEGFISATQIGDWRNRMIAIQDMVHALPAKHFATLKLVCEHLNRVASYSDRNKMSVRNLSIIFGPTLLRPPPALDSLARIMQDMPFQCTVVETLIEQAEWVFGPIEFEDEQGNEAQIVGAEDVAGETTEDGEDAATDRGVVGSAVGSAVGSMVGSAVNSSVGWSVEPMDASSTAAGRISAAVAERQSGKLRRSEEGAGGDSEHEASEPSSQETKDSEVKDSAGGRRSGDSLPQPPSLPHASSSSPSNENEPESEYGRYGYPSELLSYTRPVGPKERRRGLLPSVLYDMDQDDVAGVPGAATFGRLDSGKGSMSSFTGVDETGRRRKDEDEDANSGGSGGVVGGESSRRPSDEAIGSVVTAPTVLQQATGMSRDKDTVGAPPRESVMTAPTYLDRPSAPWNQRGESRVAPRLSLHLDMETEKSFLFS
ncbi:Rho GTPase-activating protein 21 [Borealophlyctis nickersoniae]|nr:Rho GTPase-activating protein 21 [Borealophlyctis nickersoniae]